jgi:hypothetical protein
MEPVCMRNHNSITSITNESPWNHEIRKLSFYFYVFRVDGTVVLYGCGTWSLTLGGEHRLRVFENRVMRRIFGPKRDEVTGGWRKLHNEELHSLYSSPSN